MHVFLYVSKSRILFFFFLSVLPCLNISSPCSQHSGVTDFLITVFQSTSYEFELPSIRRSFPPIISGKLGEKFVTRNDPKFPDIFHEDPQAIFFGDQHDFLGATDSLFSKVDQRISCCGNLISKLISGPKT